MEDGVRRRQGLFDQVFDPEYNINDILPLRGPPFVELFLRNLWYGRKEDVLLITRLFLHTQLGYFYPILLSTHRHDKQEFPPCIAYPCWASSSSQAAKLKDSYSYRSDTFLLIVHRPKAQKEVEVKIRATYHSLCSWESLIYGDNHHTSQSGKLLASF